MVVSWHMKTNEEMDMLRVDVDGANRPIVQNSIVNLLQMDICNRVEED